MYNVNNRAFMAKKKIYSNPHTEAMQTINVSTICGQSVTSNLGLKGGGDSTWEKAQ